MERDHQGKYAHKWGWQGYDREGNEYAMCDSCESWQCNGVSIDALSLPDTTYATPESNEVIYQRDA